MRGFLFLMVLGGLLVVVYLAMQNFSAEVGVEGDDSRAAVVERAQDVADEANRVLEEQEAQRRRALAE
jgi:hypothetical protein